MPAFEDRSTDEIVHMDKLSPEEMMELSKMITQSSIYDKQFYDFELEADERLNVLENSLMDMVIAMTISGATDTKSSDIQKKQMAVQNEKAGGRQQKHTRARNWQERTDLCNKFRQEMLSMHINALPKQGGPSGEPSKAQPKKSFWGRGMKNRYAVEEIDQ